MVLSKDYEDSSVRDIKMFGNVAIVHFITAIL
jgi:hypothetical protein